ncbi:MAG: flagellar biosynthesis protein FlhB [Pseudomonadota bacterium]
MAEESDLEKTEPASPQRLEKAREEGDVPRSRELATVTVLLAAGGALWITGENLVRHLNAALRSGLGFDRDQAFDADLLLTRIAHDLMDVLLTFIPMGAVVMLVAIASPLLIGGWLFSANALMPKFGRMSPFKGLGNMVSTHSAVELGKAIAKTILVSAVAWMVIMHQKEAVLALGLESVKAGSAHMVHLLLTTFMAIVGGLVIIAAIDAPYQMWNYANKLKMTRQEVTQEAKESDGNPQIKAKIRAQQREMARRRMMSEVPTADVVVTNPTHYAVALKYAEGKMGAPTVVAKGADEVAAKIREIAQKNNVTIMEAPPLARALFRHTELGDQIPEALYTAVAEVLAYVFQLRVYRQKGGVRPDMPSDLVVPAQLDPLNPVALKAAALSASNNAASRSNGVIQ